MRVGEIMTKGVRIAEPDEALVHAARKMNSQNIGALPVVENRQLIGMLTDRDIAIRVVGAGKDPAVVKVRDVMSEDCFWCSENESLEDAVRIMEQNRVRRLPVVNAGKEIVGMLSLEDVALHAPASLAGEVLRAVASRKRELPAA